MRKLRILLVEDTEVHRQAAIEQLKDHDLVICKNFNEFNQLNGEINQFDYFQELLQETEDNLSSYDRTFIEENKERYHDFNKNFDVILTDCLMPAEAPAYVPQEGHSKDEVPFGAIILLWAIQNNTPKAGMLMLNNHHDHPIAAGLDLIGGGKKDVRKYGNTEILISTGDYYRQDPNGEFYSSELRETKGNYIKEWGFFLQKLMGEADW